MNRAGARGLTAAAAALAATCLLGGCGFRLQGSRPLPPTLSVVRVDAVDTESDFYFALRHALLASGSRIDDAHEARDAAVIRVLEDAAKVSIIAVSTLNQPTEYELSYAMRFSVEVGGHDVIAPEEHVLIRDYAYSESAQLAKTREQAILSGALARDLVTVVMHRLSRLQAAPGARTAATP
jgi:LPS-assembly lipoprotein